VSTNVSTWCADLAQDFPVQVPTPQIGLVSLLGNLGSTLGLLGGGIGLFGDADPAVGVAGGAVSLVGGYLETPVPILHRHLSRTIHEACTTDFGSLDSGRGHYKLFPARCNGYRNLFAYPSWLYTSGTFSDLHLTSSLITGGGFMHLES